MRENRGNKDNSHNSLGTLAPVLIPPLSQEMHFRPIGRKKFFTSGRVGPLLPPGKHVQNTGSALQKEEMLAYLEKKKENCISSLNIITR